ncbi:MAG: hypothetical protein ABEJ56_02760 [Candidatus Nanohaloarchaea archaeon]
MHKVSDKLGVCLICGDRVFSDENHLKATEGYCHHSCLTDASVMV